jgi:hypothetical protein
VLRAPLSAAAHTAATIPYDREGESWLASKILIISLIGTNYGEQHGSDERKLHSSGAPLIPWNTGIWGRAILSLVSYPLSLL